MPTALLQSSAFRIYSLLIIRENPGGSRAYQNRGARFRHKAAKEPCGNDIFGLSGKA